MTGKFLAAMLVLAGCAVGQGKGEAKGPLTIEDCGGAGRLFPDPMSPQDYNLEPKFFGAEQLLDLAGSQTKVNRLIIRLQNTGRQRELSDVLRFDMPDVLAVALCVHGNNPDGGTSTYDPKNCFVDPTGGGTRVRVGTNALVHSYLTPNFKCSTKDQIYDRVGTAVSEVRTPDDGNWDSYIIFESFGSAQSSPPGPDFKIEIDDRLAAKHFQVKLEDDAVVTAEMDPKMPPVPHSHIHGMLTGDFDFAMQRGQGAQTFP